MAELNANRILLTTTEKRRFFLLLSCEGRVEGAVGVVMVETWIWTLTGGGVVWVEVEMWFCTPVEDEWRRRPGMCV